MGDLPAEIASGSQQRALVAMRDALAAHMVVAEPNVVAQIAARLQSVLTQLASLPGAAEVSIKDDLKARRASRIAAAKAPVPAARKSRKRGT